MKRIVLVTFIGSLVLALTAWGAPKDKQAKRAAKSKNASSGHVVSAKSSGHAAKTPPSVRIANRGAARKASVRSRTTANREKVVTSANTQRTHRAEAARNSRARAAQANVGRAAA